MTQTQDWFPGKDFPDREEWLVFRQPRVSKAARLIHDSSSGPLVLGINAAKRAASAADQMARKLLVAIQRTRLGCRTPRRDSRHAEIVRQRHAFYRRVAA